MDLQTLIAWHTSQAQEWTNRKQVVDQRQLSDCTDYLQEQITFHSSATEFLEQEQEYQNLGAPRDRLFRVTVIGALGHNERKHAATVYTVLASYEELAVRKALEECSWKTVVWVGAEPFDTDVVTFTFHTYTKTAVAKLVADKDKYLHLIPLTQQVRHG